MENSNDTVKVIGSMLLGSLIGATIGVLFAPHKGSKTRRKLMEGTQDISDEIKCAIKEELKALKLKAGELENMASEKMNSLSNSLQHSIESMVPQK
jgi:gas vesicle protein